MASTLKLCRLAHNKCIFNKLFHYSNRTIRTLHQWQFHPLSTLNISTQTYQPNRSPNVSLHRCMSTSTTQDKDNETQETEEQQVEESDESSEEEVESDESDEPNAQTASDTHEKSGNFCSRIMSSMLSSLKGTTTPKPLFSVGTKDDKTSNDSTDILYESNLNEHDMFQISELRIKVQELESELKKYQDALARSHAEKINIQNMNKKDVANSKKFATKGFSKDMLSVMDSLDGCIGAINTQLKDYQEDDNIKSVVEGVKITQNNLMDIFGRHGIKRIEALHQEFDPNFHEALFKMPSSEVPADHVVQVISEGYMLKDTVLRAPKVGVSTEPPQPVAEEPVVDEPVVEDETSIDSEDKKE
eukprot:82807_1